MNILDNPEEKKIRNYPAFLSNYYFVSKEYRDGKLKRLYSSIPVKSVVLEGACGKISKLRESNFNNSNLKTLIGIDLLKDSIIQNKDLDFKILANLENIPFKNNYFDIVNLPDVVEHLDDPEKVFKEIRNVLKKDGILFISTKNILNPLMAINKFLPLKIRYWVKKKVLKSQGHSLDAFHAPYQCNSLKKIKSVFEPMGFKVEESWLWGWPLISTPAVCLLFSMIYEKLTDKKFLRWLKPNIWVRLKKI